MKKISEFIVNKRKIICIVFLALTAAAVAAWFFVKINYDLSVYLPKDSESIQGMEISNEEFGDNGALTAMVSDIDLAQAVDIKKQISDVKDVKDVIWLDTVFNPYKEMLGGMAAGLGLQTDLSQMSDAEYLGFVLGILENPGSMIPGYMLPALEPMLEQMGTAAGEFFKDGKALYQITFEGTSYDMSTLKAIKEIIKITPIDMAGPAATAYAMQSVIMGEITKALIIVVPLLLLILFIATSSFFDPVVFIAVIAISVFLNMGTNIILGSVSYLTNSIAILLQVAISMDYSIFFLHAYKRERRKGLPAADSAKAALRSAFKPVSASSLTTIASFAAMLFMRYAIGFDMGLVLGKSIIMSLLTVFFFMPGFVVMTDKAITKGEHRSFLSLFARRKKQAAAVNAGSPVTTAPEPQYGGGGAAAVLVGADASPECAAGPPENRAGSKAGGGKPPFKERFAGGVIKARYVLPLLLALAIFPAYLAQSNNNFMYGELATAGGAGSLLQTNREAVEDVFGSQNTAVVLLSGEHSGKEAELARRLKALKVDGKEYITSAQSYYLLTEETAVSVIPGMAVGVPDYLEKQLVGKDNYTRIILTINTDEESDTAFAVAAEIRRIAEEVLGNGGGYYLMGGTLSTQELKAVNQSDYNLVTLLTLAFIMLVLLVTFRGLALPVILGAAIQSSIWIGMAIPFLLSEPLVFLGYLIVSCVQMGATIDYGILLSSHYTENRKTMDKFEAAKKAFLSSIGPVTTSASILMMVGFTISITGMTAVSSGLGLLVGRGTIISYLMMMFVLPGLLVIFDKPIKWTTLKLSRRKKKQEITLDNKAIK